MSDKQNPINEEELLFEIDDLASVLKVVNGYCKINLVVPQTSQFYKSDSLLPINAKPTTLNNTVNKSLINDTFNDIADAFKKGVNLKANESIEYLDDKKSRFPHKMSGHSEFQVYSEHCGLAEEKEMIKKGDKKKKKNRYNKMGTASSSFDEETFTSISKDQNTPKNIENEKFVDGLQEQELQRKQTKNSINVSKSHPSGSSYASKNIQNSSLKQKSQCPLCFKFFPTSDIETHASECNI